MKNYLGFIDAGKISIIFVLAYFEVLQQNWFIQHIFLDSNLSIPNDSLNWFVICRITYFERLHDYLFVCFHNILLRLNSYQNAYKVIQLTSVYIIFYFLQPSITAVRVLWYLFKISDLYYRRLTVQSQRVFWVLIRFGFSKGLFNNFTSRYSIDYSYFNGVI